MRQTVHQEEEIFHDHGPAPSKYKYVPALLPQLQMMMWKAADKKTPLDESTDHTKFGWEILDGVSTAIISQGDPAPLIDMVHCEGIQCTGVGLQPVDATTNIYPVCMTYHHCSGEDGHYNQHLSCMYNMPPLFW